MKTIRADRIIDQTAFGHRKWNGWLRFFGGRRQRITQAVVPLLPTNIGPMKMLLMSGWVKQVRRLLPLMKSAIDRLPPMSAWPPLLSLHFQFSTKSSPSPDLGVDIINESPLRRGKLRRQKMSRFSRKPPDGSNATPYFYLRRSTQVYGS